MYEVYEYWECQEKTSMPGACISVGLIPELVAIQRDAKNVRKWARNGCIFAYVSPAVM
jgi:hypothetical protein